MSAQDYDNAPIRTKVIGQYMTASGKIGVRVVRNVIRGNVSYSYHGVWGAGSMTDLSHVQSMVSAMLQNHPRHSIAIDLLFDNNL